ncbi:MAG TPA: nucleoside kinase [Lachnospiraceae bacterium]|nr:nucleoside kinase [Lachnospiraceae bacterium]
MEKLTINLKAGDKEQTLSVDKNTDLKLLLELAGINDTDSIMAAKVDGKLRELHYGLEKNSNVSVVTVDTVIGFEIYKRGLTLLMMKAFNDVLDYRNDFYVEVMYSLGKGLFCRLVSRSLKITDGIISKVKERMQEIVRDDLRISKQTVSTEDARIMFRNSGLVDKEKLLKYRRVSRINLYQLEGYCDYFYGYMPFSTRCLKYFDLVPYDDGFVLALPDNKDITKKIEYTAPEKLYRVLRKSEDWGKMMQIDCVGDMNDVISEGGINDLMLVQEALMEKEIAEIACRIIEEGKKVILIAGPSSSGKTTFSHRLSIQLRAHGMHPHPIALDNFFKERDETPRDEDGNYDFECLEAMDLELFNSKMVGLLNGNEELLPKFDFNQGRKVYDGKKLLLKPDDVLVCEGIHALNPKMTESLPDKDKFRIYISALNMLNIDEHNRIATTDGRLLRRMVRDARTRGNDAQKTISMWPSVRRGEEKNIFPYQEEADIMFNSALIYELSAIKQFAEPLLFKVPRDSEEYFEANRLLKFLDYFLGFDVSNIPQNSITREFIGGGCFDI